MPTRPPGRLRSYVQRRSIPWETVLMEGRDVVEMRAVEEITRALGVQISETCVFDIAEVITDAWTETQDRPVYDDDYMETGEVKAVRIEHPATHILRVTGTRWGYSYDGAGWGHGA